MQILVEIKQLPLVLGRRNRIEIIEIKKLDIGAVVGSLNDTRNENPPRVGRQFYTGSRLSHDLTNDLDATLKKVVADEAQKEPTVDEIGVFTLRTKRRRQR